MNKRSKSELNLKLSEENAELVSKIDRSKPILQTIYDKVKRKQKILFDRVYRDKRLITDYKNIANDYKKLYQQSIEMIHKTKIIDRFDDSSSNFIRTQPNRMKLQNQKSKSVYEQYRERIGRGLANSQQQKNPELIALQRENQELKNQMLSDIDKLRLTREKSQKILKKAQSSSILKAGKSTKTLIDEQLKKRQLAQKRKQRLARIQ